MLQAGSGGLITYAASLSAPPMTLGDRISIRPPDTAVTLSFGPFAVNAPVLSAGIPLPMLPAGVPIVIPDTVLPIPDIPVSIPTFEEITFADGVLRLALRNNLPVAVDVPAPVSVYDAEGRVTASFTFDSPIPPGEERTAEENVADRTSGNDLRISGLRIHLNGGGPVTVTSGNPITMTLSGEGLRARSATFAEIPPQRLVDNDRALLPLDDSTLVREARFSSGLLRFSVVNRVPLAMVLAFRINSLSRDGGGPATAYADSLLLPAGGSGSFDLDFTRLRLSAPGADFLRALEVVSSINLPAGSGGPVTVHDTDKVLVAVSTIAPLVVDTAVAVIKPTWLAVRAPVAVDFGSWPTRFSGSLNIPSATLRLATAVSFGFPTDLYVSIGARRSPGGPWVYLSVPSTQKRIQPGASAIQFDNAEVGSFLSEFSGGFPDSLIIEGFVHVNPPEVYQPTLAGAGIVGARSSVQGSVNLEIPLRLGITGGMYADTLSLGDTTGDGHQDYAVNRDRLRAIQGGVVHMEVENRLPLAVAVRARLLDHSRSLLLTVPQDGSLIAVPAAAVDGSGGALAPTTMRRTLTLSGTDVRYFDPADYVGYEIHVETPPGAGAMQFRIEDYVRVRIWSVFGYRVTP
jgi:hypothetical protein